ncbi:Tetratricopeptide repeat protein [Frankia sp. AgKG'84/4]
MLAAVMPGGPGARGVCADIGGQAVRMWRMLTDDDVDEIVFRAAGSGDHRGAAATLEELAARTENHGESVTRASLMVDAGSQFGLAQDWAEAVRCYRVAVEDGGTCEVDPRVWLHDGLLRDGKSAQAAALRAELKASRSTDPGVYEAVAESLEAVELLQDAHTWFTMGYHRCEQAPVPDFLLDLLLVGRRRVRRALGHPADPLDEVAEDYIETVGS